MFYILRREFEITRIKYRKLYIIIETKGTSIIKRGNSVTHQFFLRISFTISGLAFP